ncbi:MAG: hypothetical protein AAFQ83_21570 [Bacteroidota bacterium]
MDVKEKITQIFIKWEVDGESILSLMVSQTGAINRMGTMDGQTKGKFAMGTTDEPIFSALLQSVPGDWFSNEGRYALPDPKGKLAELTIGFSGNDVDTGIAFTYGTQSDGPPEDVIEYIEYALELTDPWYVNQTTKKKKNKL